MILLYLVGINNSFLIISDFKFCDIHNNQDILNLPKSCDTDVILDHNKDQYYTVNGKKSTWTRLEMQARKNKSKYLHALLGK